MSWLDKINDGVPKGSDQTIELLGVELNHADATNILNHHSRTKPSSSPSALMGNGLPWMYEKDDEDNKSMAGSGRMLAWILDHEGDSGEAAGLIRQHEDDELERTWD